MTDIYQSVEDDLELIDDSESIEVTNTCDCKESAFFDSDSDTSSDDGSSDTENDTNSVDGHFSIKLGPMWSYHVKRVLQVDEVCVNHTDEMGPSSRTHDDGWTIKGVIEEDWYHWVERFSATHPIHGWVRGDFNDWVCASSEAAYDAFCDKHQWSEFDWWDI